MIRLSILVPGLTKRIREFGNDLADELMAQTEAEPEAEVLFLLDNQRMSTGLKRRHLLAMARGTHFAFIDDDDFPEPDYVATLLDAIRTYPEVDVVTFDIRFTVDGTLNFIRRFWIGGPWPPGPIPGGLTGDKPSHTMCWRRELVEDIEFPDRFHGEDVAWVVEARKRLTTEINLDRVLYHYRSRNANREHADMDTKFRLEAKDVTIAKPKPRPIAPAARVPGTLAHLSAAAERRRLLREEDRK